jgi:hypothetical protein
MFLVQVKLLLFFINFSPINENFIMTALEKIRQLIDAEIFNQT